VRPSGNAIEAPLDNGFARSLSGAHVPIACGVCATSAPVVTVTRANNPIVRIRRAFTFSPRAADKEVSPPK